MTLINGFAPLIGIIPFIGMEDLGYTLSHLLILTFLFVYCCITKGIRTNLSDYRITKPYLKREWFFLGIIALIIMYSGFFIITNGVWRSCNISNIPIFITVIIITSLSTSIAEELFFRGLLLGYIERRINIYWGLIISSALFSVVHIMNGNFDLQNIIQISIGIFIAGLCYGLLTIYYKTIWSSIVIHFLFDITQLFDITTKQSNQSVMEYVYSNSNQLITGGQYGSTVSIITISSFIVIALYIIYKMDKLYKTTTHNR
ncbi:CPBP family intramembrane glutamic endopeptidase [Staphylococcus coagulans]|uniref:CPBP family intramembrane glutamic endopeptidase n=1 Tax=Staphylococcus coagulans TaxID=74706 RepID=UPI003364CBA4